MIVKVQYGASTETRNVANGTTIGQLKNDTGLKVLLGYRDNVRALFHGQELQDTTEVPEGAHLFFEDVANKKAQLALAA